MDIRSSQDTSARQIDSRNDARSRLDVRNHDARDAFSTMLDGMKACGNDDARATDKADATRDVTDQRDPKDDHRDDREDSSALPSIASLGLPPVVPQPVGDAAAGREAAGDKSAGSVERSGEVKSGAAKNDNAQANATQRTDASDKSKDSGAKDASDTGVKEAKFDQVLANALNTDTTAAKDGIDISAMLAADAGTPVDALINPATLQAMTQPQATNTQPATPAPERMVMMQTPPTTPAFRTEFADNIRMLAKDGIHSAEIRLNPADLGPIDVRIRMVDGRTDVSMTAITPEARAAIEQALPKLAEAFAAAGIQLGNTSIGQKSAPDQNASFAGATRTGQTGGNESEQVAARPVRSIPSSRLVDLYA